MNERLFNLAGQAISEVSVPLDFKHEHFLFATKFAELIVEECARVYWNIDQSETHTEYVNDLKKHFGVEE
jgi:hypothetical protein